MLSEINLLAVVTAAVATMVLGGLWYGPLFGKPWMKAHGYTAEQLESMKKGMGKAYALSFVCYLWMAAVMSMLLIWMGAMTVATGMGLAFHIWMGFAVTIGLTSHLFSNRKLPAYFLDVGYQLVYFLMMGAILAAWR